MDSSDLKRLIYDVVYRSARIGSLLYWYDINFKNIVKKQRINYKEIPVIINNFNQLFYLRQLVEFLVSRDFKKIIILDNDSSYPPLLDYYKQLGKSVKVIFYIKTKDIEHYIITLKS